MTRKIHYRSVAASALARSATLTERWLPDGKRDGREWVAINPTRNDHRRGSFKVNLRTGCWSDFATGSAGGDLISLAAYLFGIKQSEAAVRIAGMLGIDPYE